MNKYILILLIGFSTLNHGVGQEAPLWQGKGRIVVSADGNAHDQDDWGATPLILALFASQGLQDNLPLYIYSDHIWEGESDQAGYNGYEEMKKSTLEGGLHFGYNRTQFICAYDNPESAYEAVRRQINRSTKNNPLILIASGPMQVLGEGIARAKRSKLRYVTLISHGKWNDLHSSKNREHYDKATHYGWSYEEIVEQFGKVNGESLHCIHIHDQNGRDRDSNNRPLFDGLCIPRERFDWLLCSPARNQAPYASGSWEWLYSRMEHSAKNHHSTFDVSDAGMAFYILTGSDHSSPEKVRQLLEHPITNGHHSQPSLPQ